MASTDGPRRFVQSGGVAAAAEPVLHPLGTAYLAGLVALSRSASWNQTGDDWRYMLSAGRGWGLSAPDGTVLASTLVLPYGPAPARRAEFDARPGAGFAWVSMVLVLPAHRRLGYASRLLRVAIDWLDARGLDALLDATPAGHDVYLQQGFVDTWGFARYQRAAGPAASAVDSAAPSAATAGTPAAAPTSAAIRPLHADDWPTILALDAPAFGGCREALLRSLAVRLPAAARVACSGERVTGFVFGRPGREATQIGPLVANDRPTAIALLEAALAGVSSAVYVDAPECHAPWRAALQAMGFGLQRPFTRMIRPARARRGAGSPVDPARVDPPRLDPAPGDPRTLMLVAGPELG